jgi:hypothetical protein
MSRSQTAAGGVPHQADFSGEEKRVIFASSLGTVLDPAHRDRSGDRV